MFKIGSQLFTAAGPAAVREVSALGPGIFLDLKFHDIPNTVAGAVLSTAAMSGVQLVNVHALGGHAMLHAAVQAIGAGQPMGADRPRLLAVTILTSMDQKTMREVGIGGPPQSRVVKLAKLAKAAGVDGVVASVQEARAIRKACGRDFLIVTPGVRPERERCGICNEDRRPSPHRDSHRSHQSWRRFPGRRPPDHRRLRPPRRHASHRRRNRRREIDP